MFIFVGRKPTRRQWSDAVRITIAGGVTPGRADESFARWDFYRYWALAGGRGAYGSMCNFSPTLRIPAPAYQRRRHGIGTAFILG